MPDELSCPHSHPAAGTTELLTRLSGRVGESLDRALFSGLGKGVSKMGKRRLRQVLVALALSGALVAGGTVAAHAATSSSSSTTTSTAANSYNNSANSQNCPNM